MSWAFDIDQLTLLNKSVLAYRDELIQLRIDEQKLQRDLVENKKRREIVQKFLSEAEDQLKKRINILGEKVNDA